MSENKLVNPDFDGASTRDTAYWTPDGGPYHTEFGNINAPEHWTTWWREGFADGAEPDHKSGRPEYDVIRKSQFPDEKRFQSGESAVKSFTFWRRHDMGLFQRVGVQSGVKYRFSIYGHSWYSRCSSKPHTVPYDNDCETEIVWPECWLVVGIDPTGGTDPYADTVVWGNEQRIYGVYSGPLTVETTAEGDTLTVFTHSWTTHPLKHNDTYWDNAELVQTSVPPREYERTYVLYPQDATEDEIIQITNENLQFKYTIGASADDAGIDHVNLKTRTIIIYWPHRFPGGKKGLQNFFDVYYPGVDEIVWIGDDEPTGCLLWQCDPDWFNSPFGDEDCTLTICRAGCFITCLAMAQRFYKIDVEATPVTVDLALGNEGYLGCYAAWMTNPDWFAQVLNLGISMPQNGSETADAHLANGGCAMAQVRPQPSTHFVLVTRKEGERYWMLDPLKHVECWLDKLYENIYSWRIIEHVKPPVVDTTPRVSMHLQSMISGAENYMRDVKPGVVKRVTGMEDCITLQRWSPTSAVVYRHFGDQHNYLERGDPQGNVTETSLQAARDWINQFDDSLRTVCATGLWTPEKPLYVEAWNELGWAAGNLDSIQRAKSIERSFVIELMALGLPVAPGCFCAGVGNIGRPGHEEEDFLILVDLARETAHANGFFGLHSYWVPGRYPPEYDGLDTYWRVHAGRFTWIDEVLVANGVRVKWMLGEAGNAGVRYDPVPKEGGGWRQSDAFNSDWPSYLNTILDFNRRLQAWNTTHEMRCLGATLFTSGSMGSWWPFELETSQIDSLARALLS